MVERRQGCIINISSGASILAGGYTGFSAYGASKAALNRITETVATEAKELGISVFAIHPGVVHTDLLKMNFDPSVESLAPGRAARMWDVDDPPDKPAALCVFLASGAADALSGSYLSVNDDVQELARKVEEIKAKDLYKMRVKRLEP